MFRRGLLKIVASFALGLFLFDVVADTACHDPSPATTVCHACSCGTHIASPAVQQAAAVKVSTPHAVFRELPYRLVLAESFFHPPRRAA